MLSGDIITIEDNYIFDNILVIKQKIGNFLNENPINILLFNKDGEELKDDFLINKNIENEDIINVLLNSSEPPFKGEKWIIFNVKDKNKKDKIHTKKMNPIKRYWASENLYKKINDIKLYEGNLDEYISIDFMSEKNHPSPKWLERQLRYLEEFRKTVKEISNNDLVYVYAAYNFPTDFFMDFVATNKDSSIVYVCGRELGGYNYIFINGIKMNLSDWFKLSKEERYKLI